MTVTIRSKVLTVMLLGLSLPSWAGLPELDPTRIFQRPNVDNDSHITRPLRTPVYNFTVANNTPEKVWIAVKYINDGTSNYTPQGWFGVDPWSRSYLPTVRSKSRYIYVHAGTTGATKQWIPPSAQRDQYINGELKTFGLLEMTNLNFVWTLTP